MNSFSSTVFDSDFNNLEVDYSDLYYLKFRLRFQLFEYSFIQLIWEHVDWDFNRIIFDSFYSYF